MNTSKEKFSEIFSYHIVNLSMVSSLQTLCFSSKIKRTPGLNFSLRLFTMKLGHPILSFSRYNFNTLAFIAWWQNERYLDNFLMCSKVFGSSDSWHLRMKPYRRWGSLKEVDDAHLFSELKSNPGPVAALTLAKLNILQARRFAKWGKPVEQQVSQHSGKKLAFVSMRPLNTFSTFSIWENEKKMLNMVHNSQTNSSHQQAMQERVRKGFHSEFTTFRFAITKEVGTYNGLKYLSK